jgi:hypothetical protein
MLTGRKPFVAEGLDVLRMHVEDTPPRLAAVAGRRFPSELESFVAGLLAKDPHRRHATARAALDAIDHLPDLADPVVIESTRAPREAARAGRDDAAVRAPRGDARGRGDDLAARSAAESMLEPPRRAVWPIVIVLAVGGAAAVVAIALFGGRAGRHDGAAPDAAATTPADATGAVGAPVDATTGLGAPRDAMPTVGAPLDAQTVRTPDAPAPRPRADASVAMPPDAAPRSTTPPPPPDATPSPPPDAAPPPPPPDAAPQPPPAPDAAPPPPSPPAPASGNAARVARLVAEPRATTGIRGHGRVRGRRPRPRPRPRPRSLSSIAASGARAP